MKFYSQDYGVYGVTGVVAENLEQAIEFFKTTMQYDPNREIEVEDIKPGVLIENWGDR